MGSAYQVYDHLQAPVLVIQKNQGLVYFNHISSTYFQCPPRKLKQAKSIDELIRSRGFSFQKFFEGVEKSKKPDITPEIEMEIEGQIKTAILKAIPGLGNDIIINIFDVSIEKNLQEKYKEQLHELRETHSQIMHSDRLTALGELIAGVTHEISTPLTLVSNSLAEMKYALIFKDENEIEKQLKHIEDEYDRILQIVSGMQSFLHGEADEYEVCDLSHVAKSSLEFIEGLDLIKNVTVNIKTEECTLGVVNALKLQQVLINLIKNSLDALKGTDSPQVEIIVGHDNDNKMNYIDVIDNGPGVAEEIKDKIFDMFYTSKKIGEGTGLGLSISKKIVDSFCGELALKEWKSGCCFRISLPVLDIASFTQTNKYLKGERDIEGETIIVVGSDPEELTTALKILEKKEYVIILTSEQNKSKDELKQFYNCEKELVLSKVPQNYKLKKYLEEKF